MKCIAITACLLLALSTCTSASRVPFNETLLDKKFEAERTNSFCGYPRADTSAVMLAKDRVVYRANIMNDNRGAWYTGTYFCEGRTELYFRHRPHHMYIKKTTEATYPFSQGPNVTIPSCSQLQKTEVYWPWGDSRPGFVVAFKEMMKGTISIRDATYDCKRYTGSVEPVVNFLFTVAYDYFIAV